MTFGKVFFGESANRTGDFETSGTGETSGTSGTGGTGGTKKLRE